MDKQIEIKDAFQMLRISLTDRQAEQLLNLKKCFVSILLTVL